MSPTTIPTPQRPHRAMAALGGLGAATLGIGVGEVVASASDQLRSPVLDVGDRVVDEVPPWLKTLAIDWFGTNDKLALLVGIGVVLALYAALISLLALRHRLWWGVLGTAGFVAVGGWASTVGSRTDRPAWAAVPTLVGGVVVVATLVALHRAGRSAVDRTDRSAARRSTTDRSPSLVASPARRGFLTLAGGALVVGGVAAVTGRWLSDRFSAAASRAGVTLPRANRPLAAIPAAAEADLEGVVPFFTPNASFYRIDTALSVPQVAAEDWRLRIHGMVDTEIELDFAQLLQRPLVEADITLVCVSNQIGGGLLGTARWLGVRLDDLLAEAGIRPDADQVVGRSVDGYTCGFPTSALDGRDALVAVGMNGEPLPLEHGFPARLIVPGLFGYVSATKWLTEIELTRFDRFDQFWVPRGYAAQAPIHTQSRIDTPRGLASVAAGPARLGGVAWAPTRGISAVEVRVDDGPWRPADLAPAVNDATWRQWTADWDATPGSHRLTVRATDGTGAIQTEERSEPVPDGATGWHQVVVRVPQA